MESLIIEMTDDSPRVRFYSENGKLEISGKSLPENVTQFYDPVLKWLNEYSTDPKSLTELTFKLTYFNTASSKIILDILMILEKVHQDGNNVMINWNYPVYDDDMKDAGLEYAEMVELPFTHQSFNP